ncbi:MAG: DnaJ domain-containing protein, partial [Alphaproteobacteria bacterium]|nr:DnaJ domain-containing protein [Alphaproteobacteria bacterium]
YGDPDANPYAILGVDVNADNAAIRNAWIELARNHHPDRLMADGLPEEFIRAASERLAAINAAYEDIRVMRAEGAMHG